jgi:hypothetical protein
LEKKPFHQSIIGSIAMISVNTNRRAHGYKPEIALNVAQGQLRAIAQLCYTTQIPLGHTDIYYAIQAKANELGGMKDDKTLLRAYDSLIHQSKKTGTPIVTNNRKFADSGNEAGAEKVGGHPV